MQTYEVFLKKPGRDAFSHAGALDAPDDALALLLARDAYARRAEGAEMWVVDRRHILVADPESIALADRPHKHNDGAKVAAHRAAARAAHEPEVDDV